MFSERTALQLDREAWALQDERDRLDREARDLRWQEFVALIQLWQSEYGFGWAGILSDVDNGYREREFSAAYGPGRFAYHVQQFAQVEGWPSVLRAIAQAMDADAAERAEVERRR